MRQAHKMTPPQPWECQIDKEGMLSSVDLACIGVGENLDPGQLLNLAIDSGFHHICQKNGHDYQAELRASRTIIESSQSYREFPAATILNSTQINKSSERNLLMLERHFDTSSQKLAVLAEVTSAIESVGIPQTIVDDVVAASDELFTNAIFNAPFVDLTTFTNPGISRQDLEIKLTDGKVGRIFLAKNEKRLLVGCEDPYGSLNLIHYMTRIRSTYQSGPAATMNFGPGGAGIGSYIIFNAGASLFFGVWPGQVTLLCCVVPLGLSNRERSRLGKHLHWIQI